MCDGRKGDGGQNRQNVAGTHAGFKGELDIAVPGFIGVPRLLAVLAVNRRAVADEAAAAERAQANVGRARVHVIGDDVLLPMLLEAVAGFVGVAEEIQLAKTAVDAAREQRVSALRRVVRRVIVQRKVVRNGQREAVSRKIDGLPAGDGRDALAVSVVCVQPQRNAAADDKTGDQRQNILNRSFFHASSFFKRKINQSYCKPGGINCQARGRREARPIRCVCSPCQFALPCDTMNGLRRMQRGKKHGVLRV